MIRKSVLSILLILICYGNVIIAQNRKEERVEWFKEAKFGMFVHWGLYSILGGSYNGRTLPDTTMPNGKSWYSEWIQARLEIPAEEYMPLVNQFNPTDFNADEWIREAKNAGMKYFVITSKHHDGFALWDSKVSTYDLASTPFKDRDILGELAIACKKYGLKYGFYYSHWHDWEHKYGAKPYWKEQPTNDQFEIYWQEKSLSQVAELIERYDPDIFWFDTWDDEAKNHMTPKRRDELITLIRKMSDKCLINGRIAMHDPGNEIDFLEMMDNTYPAELQAKPWQTPATIQHTWAYHTKDYNWKSASQMLRHLVGNVSKGGNYLLNFGPSGPGGIPAPARQRLREMGAWLFSHGNAVYNTEPVREFKSNSQNVVLTQNLKENILYASIFDVLPANKFELPIKLSDIESITVLSINQPVEYVSNTNGSITIIVPEQDAYDSAIKVLKVKVKRGVLR